jgi:putative endonuclease
MMANWNNKVLYTGVTGNLEKRVFDHKNGTYEGFSQKYKTNKLVYIETTNDIRSAIQREKQIKNWSRKKKDFLVNQINSNWDDLSSDWYQDPSTSLGMTAGGK